MNIDALHLFVDVSQRLNFAAVAETRAMNPSSVSRAISALEDELGLRLFHRSTRRMALTEEGTRFLQRVTGILDELELARDEARGSAREPTGWLRLTASAAFGERVIVPLLPRFRETFPQIRLELLLSDSNIDLVSEGVDLAIRLGAKLEGDLIATRLTVTRYRVCASPSYISAAPDLRSPSDLAGHRCLLFTLPAFRSDWRFRARDGTIQDVPVLGDIAISSALSLRSAALGGGGPALLADWLIGDDLRRGALVDLFPDHDVTATTFDTAAWLLYPSRTYLPRKVRATIDFLRGAIRDG